MKRIGKVRQDIGDTEVKARRDTGDIVDIQKGRINSVIAIISEEEVELKKDKLLEDNIKAI